MMLLRSVNSTTNAWSIARSAVLNAFMIVVATASMSGTRLSIAQDSSQVDPARAPLELQLGFNGKFRVGSWTRAVVTFTAREPVENGSLTITVPDGDGVRTRYSPFNGSQIRVQEGESIEQTFYLKIGRIECEASINLADESGRPLARRNYLLTADRGALTTNQELALSIGGDIGLEAAVKMAGQQNQSRSVRAHVVVEQTDALPEHWFGYDGVDQIVMVTSNIDLINSMTADQIEALESYVSNGGNLILCVGSNAPELLDSQAPLSSMAPGQFKELVRTEKSANIESFARAKRQLLTEARQSYTLAKLSRDRGEMLVYEEVTGAIVPIVVRYPYGFGEMTFVASDIDQAPFSDWSGRTRFVSSLLEGSRDQSESGSNLVYAGKVTHIGYDDLSGQLRMALDRFPSVHFITFTLVAALVVLFILCIGPGDYFLVHQLIKRPEWTWLTSSVIIAVFCCLAWFLFQWSKGGEIFVNQLEIVDVDAESGALRGSVWTHFYHPKAATGQLAMNSTGLLDATVDDQLLSWQGLAGTGLGGMATRETLSLLGGIYEIDFKRSAASSNVVTSLENVPFDIASTKAFSGRWTGKLDKEFRSSLVVDRRNDTLSGRFSNPLDLTLRGGVLLFESWAYVLNDDFAPGDMIQLETQTTEKTALGFLTHRRVVDGKDVSTPWDVQNGDVMRIAEQLAFHDAAGGENYTSLHHRHQGYIDLSELLSMGRAVLLCRVKEQLSSIEDTANPSDGSGKSHWTMVRIVYPVSERFRQSP